MRTGDERAWGEFMARARPVVAAYARRAGVPDEEWPSCVDELIEDVAMRLAHPKSAVPTRLPAYLVTAASLHRRQVLRNRYRADARARSLVYECGVTADGAGTDRAALGVVGDAGDAGAPERHGASPAEAERPSEAPIARAARRLAALLAREFRAADLELLVWHGAGVTHREAAAWLGISQAAAAKRVARLGAAVARRVFALEAEFPPDERAALARLRRPLTIPPRTGA